MEKNILVLNHRGLGEILMSLPAIRWLVRECSGTVHMTVSSNFDIEACKNQRCGYNMIIFSMQNNAISIIKNIIFLRKLRISDVIAVWGFERRTVKILSALIGAQNTYISAVDDNEMTKRNIPHKSDRNINLISNYLNMKPKKLVYKDYKFDFNISVDSMNKSREKYIVFIPGSGALEKYKRWSTKNYSALAEMIFYSYNDIRIVITGARVEEELGEEIISNINDNRVVNSIGVLNINVLKLLYKNSLLAVGGDNGGMHLANASGAKTFVITGPTNSSLTAPINAEQIIDIEMHGRPWYNRHTCKKNYKLLYDQSMDIHPSIVYERLKPFLENANVHEAID